MTLVKMNPGRNMLRDTFFPNVFQSLFDEGFEKAGIDKTSFFQPKSDISESTEAYHLDIALPGLKKEDINIELQNDRLIVRGERKMEKETSDKKIHRLETSYGSFSRTYYLPEQIDKESIDAQFTDGILSLRIPKTEKELSKQIQVK